MTFENLHHRLVDHLQAKVSSGEVTERGLARLTGLSQSHVHNVLKRKRFFSTDSADSIMLQLRIDLLDLIHPTELADWRQK